VIFATKFKLSEIFDEGVRRQYILGEYIAVPEMFVNKMSWVANFWSELSSRITAKSSGRNSWHGNIWNALKTLCTHFTKCSTFMLNDIVLTNANKLFSYDSTGLDWRRSEGLPGGRFRRVGRTKMLLYQNVGSHLEVMYNNNATDDSFPTSTVFTRAGTTRNILGAQ
jgi:hypothetical protein